jgi:hypothetical protein
VLQNFWHYKAFIIYFLTFTGKLANPDLQHLFGKKQKQKKQPACLPLKMFLC